MSKTLEDYRNIVKILKLQYLKLKVENQQIAMKIGEVNPHAKSSFSDKISSLKKQQSMVANNSLIFLEFAEKCELLGITPEMVYRIADKKRQKKISLDSMKQTLKKLALRLDDGTIVRICSFFNMNKDNTLKYQDYMATINTYQIQTEKYPIEGRSYTQNALSKFGQAIGNESVEEVFRDISKKNDFFTLEDLLSYSKKNLREMEEIQLTAVFNALNMDQTGDIKKKNFVNQVKKIQATSGPSAVSNKTYKNEDSLVEEKKPKNNTLVKQKQRQKQRQRQKQKNPPLPPKQTNKNTIKPKESKKLERKDEDDADNFKQVDNKHYDIQTSANKVTRDTPKELVKYINELASIGLTVESLYTQLLDTAENKSVSFSVFYEAAKKVSPKKAKKSVLKNLFELVDFDKKGSLSNTDLLRFWIQTRQNNESLRNFYKILGRQIKMKKSNDANEYFISKKIKMDSVFDDTQFSKAFSDLKLKMPELFEIKSLLKTHKGSDLAKKINQFSTKVQDDDSEFKKPDYQKLKTLTKLIQPLVSKDADKYRFQRNNLSLKKTELWNTIFSNQWACWNYCLEAVKKITTTWKDPDFGSNKQDEKGFNSVCANEIQTKQLPEQVQWVDYSKLVQQNHAKDKMILFADTTSSSDPVQGSIGDCWIISSLSIVAQYPSLLIGQDLKNINATNLQQSFKGISPKMFSIFNIFGIYVFKFYKSGNPIYIVVDGQVPTLPGSFRTAFACSPQQKINIQWVSLAEKAYAKLHNSYSALISGDIASGLRDLTNYKSMRERIFKSKDQSEQEEYKNRLWQKLKDYRKKRMLMGCSIDPVKPKQKDELLAVGLVRSHAYSINDVFSIKNPEARGKQDSEFRLIKLRNPNADIESQLDWGELDNSRRDYDPDSDLYRKYKKQIEAHYEKQKQQAKKRRQEGVEIYSEGSDGIFLMSFDQWHQNYSNLFFGINLTSEWGCYAANDSWSKQMPGFAESMSVEKNIKQICQKNHQYHIKLDEDCDILCSLQQNDIRLFRGEIFPYKQRWIAFKWMVFDAKGSEVLTTFDKNQQMLKVVELEKRRELSFMQKFKKGSYVLMPVCKTISDANFQYPQFLKFKIEIYYNCSNKSIKVNKFNSKVQFQSQEPKEMENRKQAVELINKIKEFKTLEAQ